MYLSESVEVEGSMYPRGSEWREWDLHIHSPASFHWNGEKLGNDEARNRQLLDAMIAALNAANPAVYAIMDYWTFDGWFELRKRLREHGAPPLTKMVFPGIELRLAAPMKARLNAHVLFSDTIPDQKLRDFLSRLKLELINQPLSSDGLVEYARYVGEDKLASCGYQKSAITYDDALAYEAGCKIAEINVDSYKEAIQSAPKDQAIGFMPFSTNDGLQAVDWNQHYAYTLGLFESSPIFETRKPEQWAAFCGVETDANKGWIASFQSALRNIPRLAVSGSDAHCYQGDGTNDRRGYGDFPSGKRTWIKADPTWRGLLQTLKEPAKRSFLGERPPKLDRINQNKTFYIDRICVDRADDSPLADTWLHGTDIPLNPDLVAVIGNKGSGKSALADIIALLGNSHQNSYFSFLKRDRFRGKSGEPARQFIGTLHWRAGEPSTLGLAVDPTPDRVELVRYIPQGRFEALCNDHVSGKTNEFEKELRDVVFSHIPDAVRLDALSFDQLLENVEALAREQLLELRKSLGSLNQQIVDIEDQLHPNVRKNILEQIKLKKLQIVEHDAIKPEPVAAPGGELTDEQRIATARLGEIAEALEKTRADSRNASISRQEIGKKQRSLKNISERLALFERQYQTLMSELALDIENAGLSAAELAQFTVNLSVIEERTKALQADDAILQEAHGKSAQQETALKEEQAKLSANLNAPQLQYQAYLQAQSAWQLDLEAIQGSETEPESLKGLERRITQLDGLPADLERKKATRRTTAERIFDVLEGQRATREELFAPLQALIKANSLIREDYKLQFQAMLHGSPDAISNNLFSLIKQSSGELRGEDESYAAIRSRFDKYAFSSAADAMGFGEEIMLLLTKVSTPDVPGIRALMRKDKEPADVYNYIFGLSYLEPRYTLLFQDTHIEQLSPGQRGALLLIFYLLVDKGRNPIVLDQPEENLDNETVVSLLVPVLNEAKKSRQIIMVTHNPNLAVVCDAEQIIYATFDRKSGSTISYQSGAIENSKINRAVVDILEGTKIAFDNRGQKYH